MLDRLFVRLIFGLLVGIGVVHLHSSVQAQTDEQPLIDMAPFDVVVLTQAAGGKSVKIATLPQRNYDKRPGDNERLEVVILSHPERKYEVLWRDIEKVNLFERMVYDEAVKKLSEKDFIAAFMNLSFLMQNYPKTPNLEKLRRDFLFQSAAVMFAESRADFSRYFQTMSTLEELFSTAPDYESNSVLAGLSRVTDTLLKHYESKGDMASAKQLLTRLEKTYGDKLQSVVDWKAKLLNMAEQRKSRSDRAHECRQVSRSPLSSHRHGQYLAPDRRRAGDSGRDSSPASDDSRRCYAARE